MQETTVETQGQKPRSAVAETIGLLLSVIVAFGLGWFGSVLYARSQADKRQAEEAQAQAAAMRERPVTVETAKATMKEITSPQSFMGHVEPIQDVDLRAQIEGTIAEVAFKEGAMVKEGDLLYLIDPRVYQARVEQAKAALAKAKAASENADRYYARISKVDKRSVTEAEVDQAYANMLEARAAIAQSEADLASAEINLGYTRITAPISGRIGQSLLKKGDYVAPSMGTLARIVQTDPVRVVFSLPDKDFLRGQALVEKGGQPDKAIRAQIRLADGTLYSEVGKADFVSNEMNAATASIPVRYSFGNPKQLLIPNAYVTVLLSEAQPKRALTVPANAVLANATGDYVYINENGKAARRAVRLGARLENVVEVVDGLKEGDEVVVDGVVNVSEGAKLRIVNPSVPPATAETKDVPKAAVAVR